ncbi:FMN-dependent NADH-azoreductase [Zunongwangia pacifica]|uniref:FMN dependent NADH:quinone oxidoreductase n=1 Tax=Zunongwangia pacifica TaxID=2911062 RepID=A0A9X1ZY33_9FLAO|nr:NAD(P)H-dependent oxidoreductase [Zunongwangia pacifica]MCL6220708.1 NAD(P)H-dependent oxidoreductase [Zunongwangia pacifica]
MGKNILMIKASARIKNATSRKLADFFEKSRKQFSPTDHFIHRDVAQYPIPHISEQWIESAFTPKSDRTKAQRKILNLSDVLIAELKRADLLVLATPMYNWSIPSALKAYIDHILRMNETLKINPSTPENPYKGLLKNKKAILILVRGGKGYNKGDFYEHMDFQTEYLKTVLNIMGIKDCEIIQVEGVDINLIEAKKAVEEANKEIKSLVQKF